MRSSSFTIAARYVFPVEAPPIEHGLVTVEGGRITRVGSASGRDRDLDPGNVAILPGFVNAHTHLELSRLNDEATEGVEDQIGWLRRVIAQRRDESAESLRVSVARNLDASLAAGTTLLADTTTAGLSWGPITEAPLRAVVFAEMLGLRRNRGLETSKSAYDWLASIRPDDQGTACARTGLSPHAPYSTAGWLYQKAAASRVPLSTHLAELSEELELLQSRKGRLRCFLEDIGAWDDDWEPIGPRPADYVRRGALSQADWLIAHGTYLGSDDFWQLLPESAPDAQRVAVAYCPRTHARFGHAPHPFLSMLQHGVIVCLGTDSLASTPTLSILDEIRYLHRVEPSLSGSLLLTMATLFGAWALRAETVTGSLKPGKSADLAIVSLPDRDEPDPHHLLLNSELPVLATMFKGRFVTGPWIGTMSY